MTAGSSLPATVAFLQDMPKGVEVVVASIEKEVVGGGGVVVEGTVGDMAEDMEGDTEGDTEGDPEVGTEVEAGTGGEATTTITTGAHKGQTDPTPKR